MSFKNSKEIVNNNKNSNDNEILVYEPIRRNSVDENIGINNQTVTRKFTGLYNRGK